MLNFLYTNVMFSNLNFSLSFIYENFIIIPESISKIRNKEIHIAVQNVLIECLWE